MWLEATAARLRRDAPDLRIDTALGLGNAQTEILRVAAARAVDLIVLASNGRNALPKRILGSVADHVASAATLPVMVVPAADAAGDRDGRRLRRLIVPLDGSARAARALAVAEALATRDAIPIVLVAAIDPAYALPPTLVPDAEHASRDLLAEIRAETQQMLKRVGARIMRTHPDVSWRILDGPAANTIVGIAREGDLIVLSSRGRSGASRWPLGSVAEKVVRYAPGSRHRAP